MEWDSEDVSLATSSTSVSNAFSRMNLFSLYRWEGSNALSCHPQGRMGRSGRT